MRTLNSLFHECVEKYKDNVYLLENSGDGYKPTSYLEARREVHRFAAGLMSIGVKKGDRISLLAEGRNKWLYSEMGILYAGAINVPHSTRLEGYEIKFRVEHSESRMLIVSSREAQKVKNLQNEIQGLEKVIFLDPQDSYNENELFFDDICALGNKFLEENADIFEKTGSESGF